MVFPYALYGRQEVVSVYGKSEFGHNIVLRPKLHGSDDSDVAKSDLRRFFCQLSSEGHLRILPLTFLNRNIRPMSTRKRVSTFFMMVFSSSALNVARNAMRASGLCLRSVV